MRGRALIVLTALAILLAGFAALSALRGNHSSNSTTKVDLTAVAKLMVEVNGAGSYEIREFPGDRRAIDIGDYYADFSKIRAQLGWEPKRTLRETIEATLRYFRDSQPHYL